MNVQFEITAGQILIGFIGLLLSIIGVLILRVVSQFDTALKKAVERIELLFSSHSALSERVAKLEALFDSLTRKVG